MIDHREPSCDIPAAEPRFVRLRLLWFAAGVALVLLHAVLAWLSLDFHYERPLLESPILAVVAVELVAGAAFLLAVQGIRSAGEGGRLFTAWVILVGVTLRAIMMLSDPILEHDYYRYLWDGAVLANGENPFRYSPFQACEAESLVPERVRSLVCESDGVVSRVSFPELRTIYPPVAQAVFAAAYLLKPWSLLALRLVLSVFDTATLLLLLLVLRSLGLPSCLVAVYWWNPLVVREIVNTAHLDVIALPFTLAALWLTSRGRHLWAGVTLALAVAAKLWPLVLLPVVLFSLRRRPKRLLLALGFFGVATGLLFLPVFLAGIDGSSGFVAYGRHWEMNDALYNLLSGGVKLALASASVDGASTQPVARTLVVLVLAGWVVWLLRSMSEGPAQIWERSLFIVAAVFLLSPTGFPWYYVWVVPFLAIRPRPSLLLLNCLLPLYYLVYYFRARGQAEIFDTVVVWIEYVPFWLMAAWEWLRARKRAV